MCLWWKWSRGARDDYASVINHWKWAPQERLVIAHIKAFFRNRDRMALLKSQPLSMNLAHPKITCHSTKNLKRSWGFSFVI